MKHINVKNETDKANKTQGIIVCNWRPIEMGKETDNNKMALRDHAETIQTFKRETI